MTIRQAAAERTSIPDHRAPGYLDDMIMALRQIHERISEARGGRQLDVDAILDEIRGVPHSDRP